MPLRRSRENPFVANAYGAYLGGEPGSREAREILYTSYRSRKRINGAQISLVRGTDVRKIPVKICVGTSCFLRGSQALQSDLLREVDRAGLPDLVDVSATFCDEACDKGPTIHIDGSTLHKATLESAMALLAEFAGSLPVL